MNKIRRKHSMQKFLSIQCENAMQLHNIIKEKRTNLPKFIEPAQSTKIKHNLSIFCDQVMKANIAQDVHHINLQFPFMPMTCVLTDCHAL